MTDKRYETDKRYDGFISYSHAADGKLAPALQKALQRLAKPWYRRRSLEIFRDETGLSVDPHLWGAIVTALDDAEWFILLTSPLAARSEWVNREIEHWKTNRSTDRILPVVTDGHWQWDEATGDFTPDSDAVPAALHGVFTDEPRHLDLRWAREEQQLDLHNSRFRDAMAEVAAPLHGRTKDEIEGEDVRQHHRTVRIAWSATATLAILTVAAVVASLFAVNNANRAEQRRVQSESQRLAGYSQNEPATSDLAFLLAAQGYRLAANPLTETALFRSVTEVPPEIKERIPTADAVAAVAISEAADRVWIGTSDGAVIARRFSDGSEVGRADGVFTHGIVAMAHHGTDVVVTDGVTTATLDNALKPSLARSAPGAVSSLAVDTRTGLIAAGSVVGQVFVWRPGNPMPAQVFAGVPGVGADDFVGVNSLAWTPDGALVVAGQDGGLRRYDPAATDKPVWERTPTAATTGSISAVAVLADGTVAVGGTDGSVEFLSGTDGHPIAAKAPTHHSGTVRGVVATGDEPEVGSVASIGEDGYLVMWNHLTGETVLNPVFVGDVATSLAWDPANPLHGVTGGQSGAVLIDYGADRLPSVAHAVDGWNDVAAVAISPSGDRLAVVRSMGTTQAPMSQLVLTDPDHPDPQDPSVRLDGIVEQLTFTPDGSRVLASNGVGVVSVWDGQSESATVTEVARGKTVSQLAVSPDGTTVATGSLNPGLHSTASDPIRLWRFDGSKLVPTGQTDHTTFGYGLVFTPDGSRLVIGGTNEFAIYPLHGGEVVTVPLTDDMTRSLAIAPDGRTLAVGLWSGPIRFYDLQTGKPTGDEIRQANRSSAIAFRDNNVLVTAASDGSFRLWDLVSLRSLTGQTLTAVNTDTGVPTAPSLGLGKNVALTASLFDGRLVSWSLNPSEWIAEGCTEHRGDMTDVEKSRFGLVGSAPICPER